MVNRYFRAAAEFVKEYMQSTERPEMGRRRTASFRWRHTLRVLAAAREIGRAEGANLEIVEMAALLHDIAKLDPVPMKLTTQFWAASWPGIPGGLCQWLQKRSSGL